MAVNAAAAGSDARKTAQSAGWVDGRLQRTEVVIEWRKALAGANFTVSG